MKKFSTLMLIVLLFIAFVLPIGYVSGDTGRTVLFKDIEEVYFAFDDINWAIEKGMIEAFDDTTFKKEQKVTEGQFMTMLYMYFKLYEIEAEEKADVDKEETEGNEEESEVIEEKQEVDIKRNSNTGFPVVDLDEVYNKLRTVGIVSYGTNYSDMRNKNITIKDAIGIIVSTFDSERFIHLSDKIKEFLDGSLEDNIEKDLNEELDRLTSVLLIRHLNDLEVTFNTEVILDPELESYELHYFGDWNKRLFYFYPKSGLLVSVTEVNEEIEKEKDFFQSIRGNELEIDKSKENYIITVSNLGGKAIDFYGYAVITTDKDGPKTLEERKSFIGLRGDSKLTTLVSGESIDDMKIVLGKNIIPIHLGNLDKFPGNRFYSDRGNGLIWNMFYVGDTVEDTFKQVERRLYLQNK